MAIIHIPFPQLRGLTYPIKKTPVFNTLTVSPVSGRGEVRVPLQAYATFKYELNFAYLKGSEADAQSDYFQLVDHFMACQGSALGFPFLDKYDNYAYLSVFGFGDGSSINFQLFKQYGLSQSVVQLLNGSPTIFLNGNPVPPSQYQVNNTGQVTFATAPAAGAMLTWSGSYYIPCKYATDTLDQLEMFMAKLWECSSITLQSLLL